MCGQTLNELKWLEKISIQIYLISLRHKKWIKTINSFLTLIITFYHTTLVPRFFPSTPFMTLLPTVLLH